MPFNVLIALGLILFGAIVISGFAYSMARSAKRNSMSASPLSKKTDLSGRVLGYTLVFLGVFMFAGIFYAANERMESWQIGAFFYGILGIALIRGGYELMRNNDEGVKR